MPVEVKADRQQQKRRHCRRNGIIIGNVPKTDASHHIIAVFVFFRKQGKIAGLGIKQRTDQKMHQFVQKRSRNIDKRTHPHAAIGRIFKAHQHHNQQNQIKAVVEKTLQKLRIIKKAKNFIIQMPSNIHFINPF